MSEIDHLFKGRHRSLAQSILAIVDELREYWMLTARQVYYQAVARQLIPNNQKKYRRISLDAQGYLTTSWPGYFDPGTSSHLGGAA